MNLFRIFIAATLGLNVLLSAALIATNRYSVLTFVTDLFLIGFLGWVLYDLRGRK